MMAHIGIRSMRRMGGGASGASGGETGGPPPKWTNSSPEKSLVETVLILRLLIPISSGSLQMHSSMCTVQLLLIVWNEKPQADMLLDNSQHSSIDDSVMVTNLSWGFSMYVSQGSIVHSVGVGGGADGLTGAGSADV